MQPPAPFSLPELQMACSAKWGWSAKQTLDETQKLYEAGVVTYPRTDTGCLTSDLKQDIPVHLAALQKHPDFRDIAKITPLYRSSVFDDSRVEDHHGIIPTDQPCNPSKLDPNSKRLFDLIARRFLACLMPDAEGRRTVISTELSGMTFRIGGTIIDKQGWKAVWHGQQYSEPKKGEEEDVELPPVKDGEQGKSGIVEVDKKTTKAPPHYTEGTLLKAMLNAGSKNPDAEIRDLLSNGGLGTQATRQEIIEKLKFRDFARAEGKKIISTPRARAFVAILRDESSRLVDVEATAELERRLREVEKDPTKAADIWREYVKSLRSDIHILKNTKPKQKLPSSPQAASRSKGNGKARPARTGPRSKAPGTRQYKSNKTFTRKTKKPKGT